VKGSERPRWLLIGNSRWHWARPDPTAPSGLRVEHHPPPPEAPAPAALEHLLAWAAVGPVPAGLLPPERRLNLAAVPLAGLPPWLGIDRALAGWRAHCMAAGPVLVADAGTVLSLTWVDGAGRFRGGRLMAGAALQWRAMGAGTAGLPRGLEAHSGQDIPPEPWPQATDEAMRSGVLRGLAAAIGAAHLDAEREGGRCRLLLTGGDAAALLPLVGSAAGEGPAGENHPDLVMEALAALRPLLRD